MNKNNMKTCQTRAEAKQNALRWTDEDGKSWVQYPPYHDYIDGVDYGEMNPEPILLPAMLVG